MVMILSDYGMVMTKLAVEMMNSGDDESFSQDHGLESPA
jgi:hypothetical protein